MKINSINNQIYNTNYNAHSMSSPLYNNKNSVSFNGLHVPQIVTKGLSKGNEFVLNLQPVQNAVKWLSRHDSFKIIMTLESLYLSSWYLICNMLDKKADKEQKKQTAVHDVLTFGISTAGAWLTDDAIKGQVKRFSEKHFDKKADYYRQIGIDALKAGRDENFEQLINTAVKTAEKTGSGLDEGIKETAKLINAHLQNITKKEGAPFKAFQISSDLISEMKGKVSQAVKTASADKGAAAKLKETITGIAGKFYEIAGARKEADSTMGGIKVMQKLLIFGFMYRFAGSVFASPMAMKICKKFFPPKKDASKPAGKTA